MNSHDISNNKIYDQIKDYKYGKICAGQNCKNINTHFFKISNSITFCSVFLCDDCKRSLEHDGWILNAMGYINDKGPIKKIGNRVREK